MQGAERNSERRLALAPFLRSSASPRVRRALLEVKHGLDLLTEWLHKLCDGSSPDEVGVLVATLKLLLQLQLKHQAVTQQQLSNLWEVLDKCFVGGHQSDAEVQQLVKQVSNKVREVHKVSPQPQPPKPSSDQLRQRMAAKADAKKQARQEGQGEGHAAAKKARTAMGEVDAAAASVAPAPAAAVVPSVAGPIPAVRPSSTTPAACRPPAAAPSAATCAAPAVAVPSAGTAVAMACEPQPPPPAKPQPAPASQPSPAQPAQLLPAPPHLAVPQLPSVRLLMLGGSGLNSVAAVVQRELKESAQAVFGDAAVVNLEDLTKEGLRQSPRLIVVVPNWAIPDLMRTPLFLELKLNPAAHFVVEYSYISKAILSQVLEPPEDRECIFRAGGIVLAAVSSINEQTELDQVHARLPRLGLGLGLVETGQLSRRAVCRSSRLCRSATNRSPGEWCLLPWTAAATSWNQAKPSEIGSTQVLILRCSSRCVGKSSCPCPRTVRYRRCCGSRWQRVSWQT